MKVKDQINVIGGICLLLAFYSTFGETGSLLIGGLFLAVGIALLVITNRIPDRTP